MTFSYIPQTTNPARIQPDPKPKPKRPDNRILAKMDYYDTVAMLRWLAMAGLIAAVKII